MLKVGFNSISSVTHVTSSVVIIVIKIDRDTTNIMEFGDENYEFVQICGVCEQICNEPNIKDHDCLHGYSSYIVDPTTLYFYPLADQGSARNAHFGRFLSRLRLPLSPSSHRPARNPNAAQRLGMY
ncbi:PREDICTED: uncharacterized protein LOC108768220 [Trachymyrmex cornetzi]|uniref:uncharacterized protein LOC108768220 n=1 Tax=Trachymyrmex cornetzi TaxID=471704 RepID=UPI00084EEC24|nr:PREDICTED: uncharacterized protein LOC108768220 [Trachymyrmex cornetzi]